MASQIANARQLQRLFAFSLAALSLLALGGFGVLQRRIVSTDDGVYAVDLASRQRMLSERLTLEALLTLGSGGAERRAHARGILATAQEWEYTQRGLRDGDAALRLGRPSPAVAHEYQRVARLQRDMLTVARRIAADSLGVPDASHLADERATLLEGRTLFVERMNAVITLLQQESRDRIERLWWNQGSLLAATLLLLAVLALGVFRPFVRRLAATEAAEAEAQERMREFAEELETQNEELLLTQEALADRNDLLEQARDGAEKANRAKSDFLSHMNHELRTPLTALLGFVRILSKLGEARTTPQEKQFFERARANGEHLLALINDLLDMAKIEAGKLDVVAEPVDLATLVPGVTDMFAEQAREKGVAIAVDLPASPLVVTADAMRLRQVLVNLVGNALKFTAEGSVRVRVRTDASRRPVALDVVDSGPGIAPERQGAIFLAFEQESAGTARTHGGTGLGLPITKALCGLMGASLELESEVGRGSTFTVRFPAPAPVALPEGFSVAAPGDASARLARD